MFRLPSLNGSGDSMRIPHSRSAGREFGVSMTPMIDVVFLLLIFFVCTASFQIAEAMLPSPLSWMGTTAVQLPPEMTEVPLERVLVEISEDEETTQISINDQACPTLQRLSELLLALAAIDRTLPVILDIAGETRLAVAIDVYDRCRLVGFDSIQFAATIEP